MNRAQFHALANSYGATVQRDDNFLAEDQDVWNQRNDAVQKYWYAPWSRNLAENYESPLTSKAKEILRQAIQCQDWAKVQAAKEVLDYQIKPYEGLSNIVKRKGACLVFGAGPSLDKQIELLRSIPESVTTIVCNSALRFCLANGIRVDFCNTFDGQPNVYQGFEGVKAPNVKFLASTAVHPDTVAAMRKTGGKCFFYDKISPGLEFFDHVIPALYKHERFAGCPTGGCVVNSSVWLAGSVFSFAPIAVVGVDFGFTGGGWRCKDYYPDKEGNWIEIPMRNGMNDKRLLTAENGVKYWEEHGVYKGVIENYFTAGGLPIINCTEGGICENLPKMPLKNFLDRARQGFDTKLI